MRKQSVLFSGEMIRATLDGRKTQMRWVVMNPRGSGVDVQKAEWAPQYVNACGLTDCWSFKRRTSNDPSRESWNAISIDTIRCPYGVPGDRLWVRETWGMPGAFDPYKATEANDKTTEGQVPNRFYKADGSYIAAGAAVGKVGRWRSPRFMPRWASRINLEVTGIRVERLRDMSERDVLCEGVPGGEEMDPVSRAMWFHKLWDSINAKRDGGKYVWSKNPWVWVVEFKRVDDD